MEGYIKGIVFFFTRKSSLLYIFEEFRMNEWKSWVYFSGSCFFFSVQKFEWRNGLLTFPGKKKNTKKHTKIPEKKTQPSFIKKNRNPSKIRMNDRWTFMGKKENKLVFFFFPGFFRFAEKKYTIFGFEWMNDQRPCPRKKNTVPLAAVTFF